MKIWTLHRKMHAHLYPHTLVHNSRKCTDLLKLTDPRLPDLSRELSWAVWTLGPSSEPSLDPLLPSSFRPATSLPQWALIISSLGGDSGPWSSPHSWWPIRRRGEVTYTVISWVSVQAKTRMWHSGLPGLYLGHWEGLLLIAEFGHMQGMDMGRGHGAQL